MTTERTRSNWNLSSIPSNFQELNLSDSTLSRGKSTTLPLRLAISANNSDQCSSDDSLIAQRGSSRWYKKKNGIRIRKLPFIGIFWDIENVRVPKMKSAAAVVQKIRESFLKDYCEAEFMVVCDVRKEPPQIIQELHDSQVNLIHVSSTSKNAADEKLRQSLRRFADIHKAPSAVLLISGDVNFASDLSDLRYRKKIRIILVHNVNVADALILCANEHHSFAALTEDLPINEGKKLNELNSCSFLTIINLPKNVECGKLKNRLNFLTNNCGGKCVELLTGQGIASLKFGNFDLALRAQKRIQGEDVFGQKIKVSAPSVRCYTGQKLKNVPRTSQPFNYDLLSSQHQSANVPPPPGFENTLSNAYPYNFLDRSQKFSSPMELGYEQCQNNFQNKQEFANLGSENAFLANLDLEYDREFNYKISPELGGVRLGTQPVSLHITNLDPTMEIKEIKKLLTNMIKQYAMILSINVFIQSDGLPTAHLKVSNQQEAQFVISQLHRQKIGHKRMLISYDQNESTPDPEQLKLMVISVLQDVPDKRMPLFKFMELLESRYLCTSSLSEINKLKDIVRIKDENGSRVISLTDNAMRVSSLGNLPLQPQCVIHSPQNVKNIGWCEMTTSSLPNVMIGLKTFTGKLLMLLNVHFGSMPLVSFQNCYEQVFHEPLPVYDYGVPLEHLISCVLNVEIKSVGPNKNIKMVKHEVKSMDTSGDDQVLKAVPPVLAPNVAMLCREVVDLLKNMEKCQISLTKFVPAYHHHFGRQCRVADYGFIKLLDLLEAISHVVQIMGEGHRRVITLTHATQIRRFTSDLLRVLKVQPNKQIAVQNFPEAYEKAFSKPFNPVEYGLCSLEDLLEEIPENTVVIIRDENEELYISVPKKEQTSEEIMKTKQFANEVVDLLRHTPYYTMLFNKFVPSYHHHFGYQCRVSDYGFTKLIELFEAIPDVVEIKQLPDGERTVSLTIEKSIQILNTQIMQVMRNIGGNLTLDELPKYYLREFGYSLSPQIYGCETMEELIRKLSDYVQVVHSTAGPLLHLKEMDTLPNTLRVRCWILLLSPPHVLDLITFRCIYSERYQRTFTLEALQAIVNVVSLSSMHNTDYISLTPLYVLAAQLYYVICNNQGAVEFSQLEKCYEEYYQKPMKLSSFGIKSANMFYNKFNLIFYIRGCKKKSVVVLNKYVQEHLVFNCNSQQDRENEWNVPEQTPIGTIKRYSPPKPDTPPSPNTTWMTPSKANKTQLSFTIDLPSPRIDQQLLNQIGDLISPYPTRHWLSVNGAPWDDTVANSTAPEASELPLPNKLLPKAESDDSGDSGVNVMLDHSPSELPDSSCSNNNSGAMKKKTFQGTFLSF